MHLKPNNMFHGRYLLQEMKGRGTYGEVWLAKDTQVDVDVALKVYIAMDTRGMEEFKTEYRTASSLSHPNLLHVHHFDICEDRPYLVMPYCPGSALEYIGCADEPTIWNFIRDVASGLEYLHGMEIVHHDIKPDNILVDDKGKFVITDFGISVKFRSTLRRNSKRNAQERSSSGSTAYMAPEMFTEEAESVKASDIWAMGATLYEMMTGELPFFGQGGAILNSEEKEVELPENWSLELRNVVKACLAPNTWDRPTAKQLVRQANAVLSDSTKSGKQNLEECNRKTTVLQMEKKAFPMKWVVISIAVFLIGVGAYFTIDYINTIRYQKEKKLIEELIEKQEECNRIRDEMLCNCTKLMANGTNADPLPFIDARKKLKELKLYENRYGDQLKSLVSDSISVILDSLVMEPAHQWAEAARLQAIAEQGVTALEFYRLSLELYEDPDVRQAYEQLKKELFKQ